MQTRTTDEIELLRDESFNMQRISKQNKPRGDQQIPSKGCPHPCKSMKNSQPIMHTTSNGLHQLKPISTRIRMTNKSSERRTELTHTYWSAPPSLVPVSFEGSWIEYEIGKISLKLSRRMKTLKIVSCYRDLSTKMRIFTISNPPLSLVFSEAGVASEHTCWLSSWGFSRDKEFGGSTDLCVGQLVIFSSEYNIHLKVI